jgi:hypothetical protein
MYKISLLDPDVGFFIEGISLVSDPLHNLLAQR